MSVQGKVALITGAAEGLGRAFAEELLKKGAKGIGIADVNRKKGQETTRQFTSRYGSNKALFLHCDVASEQQLQDAFKKTKDNFGRLDIVCNNAGISEETRWRLMIDINLTAVVQGTYLAREYMSKLNGGSGGVVINVSSMAGLILGPFVPVYTATKHGVVGFTRTLAKFDQAFSEDDIRINTLCPSFTNTAIMWKSTAPDFLDPNAPKQFASSFKLLPVSKVAEAFMRLIEEGHHDKVMRVTQEKGIDFHKFRGENPLASKM